MHRQHVQQAGDSDMWQSAGCTATVLQNSRARWANFCPGSSLLLQ